MRASKHGICRDEWSIRAREFVRRGTDLPHSKLCERSVRAIRANRNGWTFKQQAAIYGVHWRTIEKIRRYETWVHVK